MGNESPLTKLGQKMFEMHMEQSEEHFKRSFGYPVGVDFMTMRPIYWAPPHEVARISTFSGRSYSDLNDPGLFVGYRMEQIR